MFPNTAYCTVRWRVATLNADGPDSNQFPDWLPAVGTSVILTPSTQRPVVFGITSGEMITAVLSDVQGILDSEGYLCHAEGAPNTAAGLQGWVGRPVHIVGTNTDMSVPDLKWTATAYVRGMKASASFQPIAGTTIDLSDYLV